IPLPPARDAAEVLRRASLVELRRDVIARVPDAKLVPLAGAIAIRGLAGGDYRLRAPGLEADISVAPVAPAVARRAGTPHDAIELAPIGPAIVELAIDGSVLRIGLAHATPRTRVHVIARRFGPSPIDRAMFGPRSEARRRYDRERAATYLSGRDIGDE